MVSCSVDLMVPGPLELNLKLWPWAHTISISLLMSMSEHNLLRGRVGCCYRLKPKLLLHSPRLWIFPAVPLTSTSGNSACSTDRQPAALQKHIHTLDGGGKNSNINLDLKNTPCTGSVLKPQKDEWKKNTYHFPCGIRVNQENQQDSRSDNTRVISVFPKTSFVVF